MTSPIVTIKDGELTEKSGSFKNDAGENVEYHTRKQPGKLETSDGFVYPYDVKLEKDQKPYAPGRYELLVGEMLTVAKGQHLISKYPVLRALPATKSGA